MILSEFTPEYWMKTSKGNIIQVQFKRDLYGDVYAYSALYDVFGKVLSHVCKDRLRESRMGHLFFVRCKDRFYVNDFQRGVPEFRRVD